MASFAEGQHYIYDDKVGGSEKSPKGASINYVVWKAVIFDPLPHPTTTTTSLSSFHYIKFAVLDPPP